MFLPSHITLQFGDSGDYVAELQRRLAARDYLGRAMITAFYDGPTVSAVRSFQIANGLNGDGVAGPETLRRLNSFFSDTESGGAGDESEQESSIKPTRDQYLVQQMNEAALLGQEQLAREVAVDSHAAASERQVETHLGGAQKAAAETLEKELLKDKPLAADPLAQQQQQLTTRAEMRAHAQEMAGREAQPNVAFVDRPIAQTISDAVQAKPADQLLEREVGGQSRGPELAVGPTVGVAKAAAPEASAGAVSVPKEAGASLSPERSPERMAERPPEPAAAQNAAPAAPAKSSVVPMSPEFARISQQMEAKLQPHVVEEVKEVGVVMLQQGVKQGKMPEVVGAPERTPGMDERQAAIGGGRGV